jgi:MFS family permease
MPICAGHIGDKYGRRWSFTFAILQQAFGTFLIGILPTYAIGRYSAGIASPILLASEWPGLLLAMEMGPRGSTQ